MQDFAKQFKEDAETIKRFKLHKRINDINVAEFYLAFLILAMVVYFVSKDLLGIPDILYGIENPAPYAAIIFASLSTLGFVIFYGARPVRRSNLSDRKVAYHYLAEAILEYEESGPSQSVISHLIDCNEYCEQKHIRLVQPVLHQNFINYVESLSELDEGTSSTELEETFDVNIPIIVEEIQHSLNAEFSDVAPVSDYEEPTSTEILLDTTYELLVSVKGKRVAAIFVLIIAALALIAGWPRGAIVVLGSYPVIQTILPLREKADSSE